MKKRIGKRFIYYEDVHGYIKCHMLSDGNLYVDELVVYKLWRGNGFGKIMANMLPIGTQLIASAIIDEDGTYNKDIDLIKFYESCGFELQRDNFNNNFMVKIC